MDVRAGKIIQEYHIRRPIISFLFDVWDSGINTHLTSNVGQLKCEQFNMR